MGAAASGAKVILAEENGYLGGCATAGLVAPFMTCYDLLGEKQIIRGVFDDLVRRLVAENGACYINKVQNIIDNKNRISGKMSMYEMPEYTSYEIDEPDDFIIIEKLMERHLFNK